MNIEGEPKPILLTMKPDGMRVGIGPLTVKGFLIESSGGGGSYETTPGHWESQTTTTTHEHTALEASSTGIQSDPTLRQNGQIYTATTTNTTNTYTPGTTTYSGPTVSYIPRPRTAGRLCWARSAKPDCACAVPTRVPTDSA